MRSDLRSERLDERDRNAAGHRTVGDDLLGVEALAAACRGDHSGRGGRDDAFVSLRLRERGLDVEHVLDQRGGAETPRCVVRREEPIEGQRRVHGRFFHSCSGGSDSRAASTLSTRLPSRSTTSKRHPSHSTESAVRGSRPSSSITMPASVL